MQDVGVSSLLGRIQVGLGPNYVRGIEGREEEVDIAKRTGGGNTALIRGRPNGGRFRNRKVCCALLDASILCGLGGNLNVTKEGGRRKIVR